MNMKMIKLSISVAVFGLAFCALQMPAMSQGDRPVEQLSKNIQVLKGLPASQMLTVMHLMRASLGVQCDYCHVAENEKYWMDDKQPKKIARQMILMTAEINKREFGGKPVVTCNTCHNGRVIPVATPPIGPGTFDDTIRVDPNATRPAPLPAVEEILDRHARAVGGGKAVDLSRTRFIKSSMLRPKVVDAGTPKVRAIARGEAWPVEIYIKAPNKYLAVLTSPNGIIQQGFNGTIGWIKSPNGVREMTAAETARIKRQADLYRNFNLKDRYRILVTVGKEKIGDRAAYLVDATALDGKEEKLYFDVQTGLLLRRVVLTATIFGLDPEQTDFEDYREVDGIKLPFIIRASYLDDTHLGTTRKVVEVKHNVAVDDAKFEMPAAKQ